MVKDDQLCNLLNQKIIMLLVKMRGTKASQLLKLITISVLIEFIHTFLFPLPRFAF